jgi:hypothetical protein
VKCPACPAHDLPGVCPGELSPGACRLPALDPRYADVFRAAAKGEVYPEEPRVVAPWNPGTPGPDPADWIPSEAAPPPPAPPSLLSRAASFAGALADHVAHGLPHVPDAEKARRLAICRACPNLMPDGATCNRCGCNMPIKTGWLNQKCPLNPPKW